MDDMAMWHNTEAEKENKTERFAQFINIAFAFEIPENSSDLSHTYQIWQLYISCIDYCNFYENFKNFQKCSIP